MYVFGDAGPYNVLMCEQLWLEFTSTELALKFKDAFEDARVPNNAMQEIMSSCKAC